MVAKAIAAVRAWWSSRRTNLDPASVLWLWWCAALLAHYDDRMHWRIASVFTASVVAAALGMLCTRSALAMLVVAGLQLGALWHLLPGVDNHWAFAGFVDLALVGATVTWIIRRWRRGRRIAALDDDWYRIAAPIIRLLVLVMYGFAVFHKLNADFLEPSTSCAVHFYHRLTRTPLVPLTPGAISDGQGHALVATVLLWEAAIPILLFGRRTWFLGIAAGVAFHLATGMFMRHYPSIMIALYWVFVPMPVQHRWIVTVDTWIRRATRQHIGYVGVVIAQAFLLSAATMLARWMSHHGAGNSEWYVLRAWNACVILGSVLAIAALFHVRGLVPDRWPRFASPAKWLYGLVLVFAFNCLSPYLGLKTATSINMWSNLVVTGTEGNHVLLSSDSIRVFDYTADVVTVVRSSDEELGKLARAKDLVPWLSFKQVVRRAVRRARAQGKVSLTYVRDGARVRVADAANDAALMDPGSYWERKLIKVKSTPGRAPGRCSW